MTYAHIENNTVVEYPVYEGDIKLRFSNTSFPIPFEPPVGYEPVVDVIPPEIDYTKNVEEGTPELIDGQWTRVWNIVDATPEQIQQRTESKSQQVRSERNSRLSKTDVDVIRALESGSGVEIEIKNYRQALRDVPEQIGFPWDIEWPEPPTGINISNNSNVSPS